VGVVDRLADVGEVIGAGALANMSGFGLLSQYRKSPKTLQMAELEIETTEGSLF
jgi:hypothetical protein